MEHGRLDLHLHDSCSDLYTACSRCFECGLYRDAVMPTPPAVTITVVIPSRLRRSSRSGSDLRWNKNLYVHLYQLRWHYDRLDLHLHHSGPTFTLPAPGASSVACITDAVMPTPPAVTDNCGNTITPSAELPEWIRLALEQKPIRSPIPIAMAHVDWIYTYTIAAPTFTLPAAGASSVACIADAVLPTPPAVTDNCGNTITHRWSSRSGSDLRWNKNLYVHLYQLRWHYGRLDLHLHDSGADLYTACTRCFECGLYRDAVLPTPPAVTDNCGNTITHRWVPEWIRLVLEQKPIRSPIPIVMEQR
jgi:hypothetical protein